MSKIELLNDLEKQRAALEKRISDLSEQVKTLADYSEEIKSVAKERGLRLRDIALAIAPELNPETRGRKTSTGGGTTSTRQPRRVKVYRHPDTGEVIETKGGNHKLLKEWKSEYGAETVEGWVEKND
ncbi:histone-like nucleoid-structuring protein, MvaT/MvaU family (plasmid) [Pseudomonas sp. FeN3W]|nr:histone-like nucleoid-structuring protein, MvaT/MvaU family [Pseudomonas sp. FeN3W]